MTGRRTARSAPDEPVGDYQREEAVRAGEAGKIGGTEAGAGGVAGRAGVAVRPGVVPSSGAAAFGGTAPVRGADVRVRELRTHGELERCVRLQRQVWGAHYRDSVPASLIKVSQKVGGLAAGAFVETGELVGFVFGLTGVEAGGRVVHWSHMLGVSEAHRNRGIGRRLKQFQLERLREQGVDAAYWTFDPLVARNAHLNVNHLQVRLVDYIENMYADTGSDLHAFGTDRFVAAWPIGDGAGAAPTGGAATTGSVPATARGLDEAPVVNGHVERVRESGPATVRVEIPLDAESMRTTALEELREWRRSTRGAFVPLFDRGYAVSGFYRANGRCYYVLRRSD